MSSQKIFNFAFLMLFFGCSSGNSQTTKTSSYQAEILPNEVEKKGWSHLLSLLVREGVNKKIAEAAFTSREMPAAEMLTFNLNPQEKHSLYKGVNTANRRMHAYNFYLEHRQSFDKARQIYGVPESVILAILQVETGCGQNTGDKDIFPAIARLANAGAPDVVRENLKNKPASLENAVYHRAAYLETTFLPHLVAAFKIAPRGDVHLLRGSFAGAMGLPQFMPGNILKFGVDGNGDGKVDVYDPADAILSVANYLKIYGWTSLQLSQAKKRNVIWEYNHSTAYIDTVLGMAAELQKMIDPKTSTKSKSTNVTPKKSTRLSSRSSKKLR